MTAADAPPPDPLYRPPAELFGAIDIYLFDQILRGRIRPGMRILDAGCGSGRNLVYFLRAGYEVYAVDHDPETVERVRELAAELAPRLPAETFRAETVEAISFEEGSFDVVVSSAVLHFARDEEHFTAMLDAMWRVLAPGGLLFCRLASDIGMEGRFRALGGGWFELLDGSERYLVDANRLRRETERLGGAMADPLKTTVVHDLRCMTTWVVRKPG